MPIKNNNAQRLITILDGIRNGKTNESVENVIKSIFPDVNGLVIGIQLGEIYGLANKVVKQIYKMPGSYPEVHLKWQPNVYKALSSLSVAGNINNFKTSYTDKEKAYLECVSAILSDHYPDLDIDTNKLANIYNEISDMIDSLQNDNDINLSLKNFIIDKLIIIQDTINGAKYMGYENLISAAESAFAGTILRTGESSLLQDLKNKSPNFAYYIDWLGRLLILLEVYSASNKVLENTISKLMS